MPSASADQPHDPAQITTQTQPPIFNATGYFNDGRNAAPLNSNTVAGTQCIHSLILTSMTKIMTKI